MGVKGLVRAAGIVMMGAKILMVAMDNDAAVVDCLSDIWASDPSRLQVTKEGLDHIDVGGIVERASVLAQLAPGHEHQTINQSTVFCMMTLLAPLCLYLYGCNCDRGPFLGSANTIFCGHD